MEIICPSCNKVNPSDPCARCGCELASLFAVRRAAEVELATAAEALRAGADGGDETADTALAEAAGDAAVRSWELHHTPEAARLAFLSCIALGDFETAHRWVRRCG